MPSRLIEAETITGLTECHDARGMTVSQRQDDGNGLKAGWFALLRRKVLTKAQKNAPTSH